jgi:hypothetical protein
VQAGDLQLGTHGAAAVAALDLAGQLRDAERAPQAAAAAGQQKTHAEHGYDGDRRDHKAGAPVAAHGDHRPDDDGLDDQRQQAGAGAREQQHDERDQQRRRGQGDDPRASPQGRQQQHKRPAQRQVRREVVGVEKEGRRLAAVRVDRRRGGQVDAQAPLRGPDEQRETIDDRQRVQEVREAPPAHARTGRRDRDGAQGAEQEQVAQAGAAVGRPGQGDHQPAKPGAEQKREGRRLEAPTAPHDDEPQQPAKADEGQYDAKREQRPEVRQGQRRAQDGQRRQRDDGRHQEAAHPQSREPPAGEHDDHGYSHNEGQTEGDRQVDR